MSNPAQVSKVVHEAIRALKQTQGDTSTKSYEELSDHDRSTVGQTTSTVSSGVKGGVDIDSAIQDVAPDQRLEAYITHGIVNAFNSYDEGVAKGGNTTDATADRDTKGHVDKEVVDAKNAQIRQGAGDPEGGTASNIHDAINQADKGLAAHNAEGKKSEE